MGHLRPLLLLALAVVPAAQASAQSPPPAAPAKAKIALDLQKVGFVDRAVAFTGKAFRVRGTVTPFVAGQRVRLRAYRGKQLVSAKIKPIVASETGQVGLFRAEFKTKFPGNLRVGVTHVRTAEMAFAHARTDKVAVIGTSSEPGRTGHTVKVMQGLLREAGYVTGRYGVYDDRTARAVHAFRKMSGLARTFTASRVVLRRLLNGGGRFQVRFPQHGHHVEADLTHQVLALIDDGKVERLYPMSSGAPSTPTILGSYRVYLKGAGTNAKGMVHSSFFIRGYAIHGYASVPPYPASHGCLRVPVPDAWSIFSWVRHGDYVDTYYRSGTHRSGKPGASVGP
ncbi:MAG: L,D-transpeptidase [Solirubrobacteraceae bacterium]